MLALALSLALVSPIALVLALRAFGQATISWSVRAAFWMIGLVCFWIVVSEKGTAGTLAVLGLKPLTLSTLWLAAGTSIALMAGTGVIAVIHRLLKIPLGDRQNFEAIAGKPLNLRIFVVLTAGVIEELLYRGIGIGLGAEVLGNPALAASLATAFFVFAHFRWRTAHLLQVLAAGAILSSAFVMTGNLWACMLAHLLVDGIGFLLMPALIARKKAVGATRLNA